MASSVTQASGVTGQTKPHPLSRLETQSSGSVVGPVPPVSVEPKGLENVKALLERTAAVWVCLMYLGISGSLILINKYIMIDDGFHYPLTVGFMGMLMSAFFSFVVCKAYNINVAKDKIDARVYITKVAPIGFCMAVTLHLGNLVYFYLSVSLIQMLKATAPIMVMVALFVTRMEKPSAPLILSVLVIVLGTALASLGTIDLSFLGLLLMLSAEFLEATKLVMMQKLLVGLEFHPIEGLMYLAPACCFWLGLEVLFVEAARIAAEEGLRLVLRKPLLYACAATMGFFVNLSAYMVIQHTNSLMLKLLGTVRSALIVFIATFALGEIVTWLQYTGYTISLCGFYLYTKVRAAQARAAFMAKQAEQQAHKSRPGSILNVR